MPMTIMDMEPEIPGMTQAKAAMIPAKMMNRYIHQTRLFKGSLSWKSVNAVMIPSPPAMKRQRIKAEMWSALLFAVFPFFNSDAATGNEPKTRPAKRPVNVNGASLYPLCIPTKAANAPKIKPRRNGRRIMKFFFGLFLKPPAESTIVS